MRCVKAAFFAVFGLIAGAVLLGTGYHDFRATRQLQREAALVEARVVSERTQYRSNGRSRRYLTVEFKTKAGQIVTRETAVDSETHLQGADHRSVLVHYLPGNPTILRAGSAVKTEYGNLLLGVFLFTCGGLSLLFIKRTAPQAPLATDGTQHQDASPGQEHQYVSVNGRTFKGVDQQFYESTQREFESEGFVLLDDIEVIPARPQKGFPRTFVRLLLSADGTQMANIFHVRPGFLLRLIGAKESRVHGIDTQMADDSFVCTDNAEGCATMSTPPDINAAHLPSASTVAMVVDTHKNRVEAHTVFRVNATPVKMRNLEDVRRGMRLQNQIKTDFYKMDRQKKAELEHLTKENDHPPASEVHLDLEEHREPARRKAA